MSSKLHYNGHNVLQGDYLLTPCTDSRVQVVINVSNAETKRADYFSDEVTALRCQHELLRSNHRELQGHCNRVERDNDEKEQTIVALRNEKETLTDQLHREVHRNAEMTNRIAQERHIRRQVEDLLNQVLNAPPQPVVTPTNVNAIITPQRQPRATNINIMTLEQHRNYLEALNVPNLDASSPGDFNLRAQNDNRYLELPSDVYYHSNAHLHIFPTSEGGGVYRSVPTKHEVVKRQYNLIVDVYRGFLATNSISPFSARGDSTLFKVETVGKVKAFLSSKTIVWEAIPSKYEISYDSDMIRLHTKKLAGLYSCPPGSFELLMMIAHDNQNTIRFTRIGNTIQFPAYRQYVSQACVSQYKTKKAIMAHYGV
ncbi:predicted protein [Chaetoceros tenuissimus]|uniref:Uncharacterized protein n=1 Tax=Chaetoceros tenuissimus TaxID=426638 RepID=A0AAD3HB05_9STRA|nr:predicted protein [Chaetoceros tenuissimus]GFH56731.1 predicted protein [Chaetoceros tenuissimus]